MPSALRHLQIEFGNENAPLIAYNGGLVLNNNTILHSTFIKNAVLAEIINQCTNTTIHLSLFHADEWYVPSMDYWAKREESNTKVTPTIKANNEVIATWEKEGKGAHKIMCMGDEAEIDKLYKTYQAEKVLLTKDLQTKRENEIINKEKDIILRLMGITRFGEGYGGTQGLPFNDNSIPWLTMLPALICAVEKPLEGDTSTPKI